MSDAASPNTKRTRLLIAIAVLAGAILLLIVTEFASVDGAKPAAEETSTPTTRALDRDPVPDSVRAFAAPAARVPVETTRSPLADALHASQGTARDDLATVAGLFATHFEQFRALPVGDNAEITAALAGDNSRGYAPLPSDHPAINPRGELVDRWGTAFFFHQLSGDLMEIRSAGPDRRMHTGDDLVWPSSPELAQAAP